MGKYVADEISQVRAERAVNMSAQSGASRIQSGSPERPPADTEAEPEATARLSPVDVAHAASKATLSFGFEFRRLRIDVELRISQHDSGS